ncbi:NAD(P)-dependent oxidoreductase [Saccharomonospora iraqiensis]|uniref:NAD(P)-dependent oxidoreductase n=1 Tax=Saccharomonospora iraqiensis TaxID=52698 RepID=UPI00022E4CCA|nr:NAD(P)-dependent oxidoreductase [Saccharomonospora iraqiensis]
MTATPVAFDKKTTISPVRVVPPLPVLNTMIHRRPCPELSLVLVTHLLDTAVPFVRALASAMSVHAVVAVPYSLRDSAHEALAGLVPVHTPSTLSEIGPLVARLSAEALERTGRSVVVQEVGGYCATTLDDVAGHHRFLGVVEDTHQGQWRYEERQPLRYPVYTIADSPLKDLENRQVGRSLAYSMDHLLRTRFFRHVGETSIAVLGYGGIGSALAATLRALGSEVAVYDTDDIKTSRAMVDGHLTMPRDRILGWADVVLGVSGTRSFTVDDLAYVRDGTILASGSSKKVEFDVDGMRSRGVVEQEDDVMAELIAADRRVFLLNDGRPVNFLAQSVLGNVLDLIYSELYLCTRNLGLEDRGPGIHRLDAGLQQEIARTWKQIYGDRGWS